MEGSRPPVAPSPGLEVVRYTLLSIGLAIGSLLLLRLYDLALIALPLPALVTTARFGARSGIVVAVSAALPVVLLAWPLSPLVLAATLTLGVGQALMARAGVRPGRILAACISVFIILAAAGAGTVFATGALTVSHLVQDLTQTFKTQISMYPGISPQQLAEAVRAFRETYVYLIPGGIIVASCAVGLASFLVSQHILRARGLPSVSLPPFSEWQLPWYLAWGLLLGLAGAVGAGFLPADQRSVVMRVGSNLIVIFGALFTVQGLSIVFFLFRRYQLPPFTRALSLAVALLLQALVAALTVLGLLDVWFNYRRLKAEE